MTTLRPEELRVVTGVALPPEPPAAHAPDRSGHDVFRRAAAWLDDVASSVRTAPFELWPTVALLSGIALLNRQFVHIGFRQFYVTEVVVAGVLMGALLCAPFSPRHRATLRWLCGSELRWLQLLGAYAIGWLLVQHQQGLLAVRHSMMVFFASFIVLFAFAFTSAPDLARTLGALAILTSTFNTLKILHNRSVGLAMENEPLRVAHNEVDVICASLCLIGLALLPGHWLRKRWFWVSLLGTANVVILVLTVKRTAALGLVIVLLAGLVASGTRETLRTAVRLVGGGLVAALVILAVLAVMEPARTHHVADFLASKMSVSTEKNATWRLSAWHLAWQRFQESPWFGIGYGRPILQTSLEGTRTTDPHNSYLAFLARHGLVGAAILLGLLIQVLLRSWRGLRASPRGEVRSLRLFFLLAFVYMLVFAAFNVVLENQYEGVFFWFALSGIFLLDRCCLPGVRTLKEAAVPVLWQDTPSSVAGIRGGMLTVGGLYGLLVASPWNYLPRVTLFDVSLQAQVPQGLVADSSSAVEISATREYLHVLARRPHSTWSAITWALPEDLADDFRFHPPAVLAWSQWPALRWILPEDFTRAARHTTDYALVLELTTIEQAHKPYRFRLDGAPGERYEATGYAAGTKRVVPLSEFAARAHVEWSHLRELIVILPDAPEPLSLQIVSLALVRRRPDADLDPEPRRAPGGDCGYKYPASSAITGFETYDGRSEAAAFAFEGPGSDGIRGGLWTRSDGTGTPVFRMIAGANHTRYAFSGANTAASGWGLAYGFSLRCLDASRVHGLSFWARGTAPGSRAWVSVQMHGTTPARPGTSTGGDCSGTDPSYDCVPARAPFVVGDTWQEIQIPWTQFDPGFDGSRRVALDGTDINGLFFSLNLGPAKPGAAPAPQALELAIDEVGFY